MSKIDKIEKIGNAYARAALRSVGIYADGIRYSYISGRVRVYTASTIYRRILQNNVSDLEYYNLNTIRFPLQRLFG